MRRALRRVRWGLLAAGALGLAGPSLAQAPAGAAGPAPTRAAVAPAAPKDEGARLEAIQVELAWLADPLTFPYPLTARPAGGTLEVRGEVPGPGVKQLALTMARAHSTLPVTDQLTEWHRQGVTTTAGVHAAMRSSVSADLAEFECIESGVGGFVF